MWPVATDRGVTAGRYSFLETNSSSSNFRPPRSSATMTWRFWASHISPSSRGGRGTSRSGPRSAQRAPRGAPLAAAPAGKFALLGVLVGHRSNGALVAPAPRTHQGCSCPSTARAPPTLDHRQTARGAQGQPRGVRLTGSPAGRGLAQLTGMCLAGRASDASSPAPHEATEQACRDTDTSGGAIRSARHTSGAGPAATNGDRSRQPLHAANRALKTNVARRVAGVARPQATCCRSPTGVGSNSFRKLRAFQTTMSELVCTKSCPALSASVNASGNQRPGRAWRPRLLGRSHIAWCPSAPDGRPGADRSR